MSSPPSKAPLAPLPEGLPIAHLPSADLTIRPVGPGDFDGLMALLNAGKTNAAAAGKVPATIRRKAEGDDQKAYRLLALFGDEIIGQAALTFGFGTKPTTGLLTILVREDQRGRRVGTALLTELLIVAKTRLELKRVEVSVFSDNRAAIRLYQSLGFSKEARHVDGAGGEILLMSFTSETHDARA